MFIVYSESSIPCYKTFNEAEADYMSFCVGGYYVYQSKV